MTIFCYHSVAQCWESPLAVEPADFGWQAGYLARRRRVRTLQEAIPRLDRTGRLPRDLAALTFDDGFEALYHEVLPGCADTVCPRRSSSSRRRSASRARRWTGWTPRAPSH